MRNSRSGSVSSSDFSGNMSAPSKVEAPRIILPESPAVPQIVLPDDPPAAPKIVLPGEDEPRGRGPSIKGRPPPPSISVDPSPPTITIGGAPPPPQIIIPGDDDDDKTPSISVNCPPPARRTTNVSTTASKLPTVPRSKLSCAGCKLPIIGRLVTASNSDRGGGLRWHPECFKCTICSELLEHVSSYERDGKMYCHLDFYEVRQHRFFSSRVSNVLFRLLLRNAPIVIPQSLRNISYRWTIPHWVANAHITHNTSSVQSAVIHFYLLAEVSWLG